MSGFTASIPESADPKVHRLVEFWESIHPHGALPGRQHFDPLDLVPFWPNLRLLEVSNRDPLILTCRYVGIQLVEYIGRDFTGQSLIDAWSEQSDTQYILDLSKGIETKRPHYRKGPPRYLYIAKVKGVESLYLPLARDGHTDDMLMTLTLFHL
jgi:hypothetical protein